MADEITLDDLDGHDPETRTVGHDPRTGLDYDELLSLTDTEHLKDRLFEYNEEDCELREELGDKIEEVMDNAKMLATAAENDIPSPDRVLDEDLYPIEDCKKGMEVITPNGPGEVLEAPDENDYVKVRLVTTHEIFPYPVNRLRRREAAILANEESFFEDDLSPGIYDFALGQSNNLITPRGTTAVTPPLRQAAVPTDEELSFEDE